MGKLLNPRSKCEFPFPELQDAYYGVNVNTSHFTETDRAIIAVWEEMIRFVDDLSISRLPAKCPLCRCGLDGRISSI